MVTTSYFVESDYDLTLRLQKLFHETVDLQTKLDNAEVENSRLKDERRELALKLKEAHKEISMLVMKMKNLLSDNETSEKSVPQTLGASKRSNRVYQTGQASAQQSRLR